MRVTNLLIAATAGAIAWMVVAAAADSGPTQAQPIIVADKRLASSAVQRPGVLTAVAGDRAIERAWLEGELRVAPGRPLRVLRAEAADRLAPGHRLASSKTWRSFARAFEAFHARWRARTRCLSGFHDPVMERCAGAPASSNGACRWMGEATVCRAPAARLVWLVLHDGRTRRLRSRAAAMRQAVVLFRAASASRQKAAKAAREEAARAAALAALEVRRAAPQVSAAAARALGSACTRYRRELDLYEFGALQDPAGWAVGVRTARRRLARAISSARADAIDAAKLAALTAALGDAEPVLGRLTTGAAGTRDDLRRFADRAGAEAELAQHLGLARCAGPLAAAAPR